MHAATLRLVAASAVVLLLLGACESGDVEYNYPERIGRDRYDPAGRTQQNTVFGPSGMTLLGGGSGEDGSGASGGGIGVNSFLWRASLDTIAFMPLASADPFGGVIITDWYTPPATPEERFKMTVYILDRTLRSDGVRVAVFRQRRDGSDWLQQPVAADTASNLENAILARARQLRIDQAGG